MDEIEPLEEYGICESCGKSILQGEKYCQANDSIMLCENCAPTLSECIKEQEAMLNRIPFAGDSFGVTREEMKASVAALRKQLADEGDVKCLVDAED